MAQSILGSYSEKRKLNLPKGTTIKEEILTEKINSIINPFEGRNNYWTEGDYLIINNESNESLKKSKKLILIYSNVLSIKGYIGINDENEPSKIYSQELKVIGTFEKNKININTKSRFNKDKTIFENKNIIEFIYKFGKKGDLEYRLYK